MLAIQALSMLLVFSVFLITLSIIAWKLKLNKDKSIINRLLPRHTMSFKSDRRGVDGEI